MGFVYSVTALCGVSYGLSRCVCISAVAMSCGPTAAFGHAASVEGDTMQPLELVLLF